MKLSNYLFQLTSETDQGGKGEICLHGCSSIIKDMYFDIKKNKNKKSIRFIYENIKVPYQTLYCWVNGSNPIPISKALLLANLWKSVCNKENSELSNEIDKLYAYSLGYSQNGERRVLLPKEIDKDLGYLTGFFQGDGHLKKINKIGFQEHSIYFYEASVEMLNKLNNILAKEFGIRGNIYYQKNETGEWYTLRVCSKPIYLFLRDILNLPSGRKTRNVGVPEIIKSTSKSIQLSFIRGFFDAEGGVGETDKNPWLDIGQASKDNPSEIISWIHSKLKENNIELSEPKRTVNQEFFRIRTSKRDTIQRFYKIVSSYHPVKARKFMEIIRKC